jgi:hypothetical protein
MTRGVSFGNLELRAYSETGKLINFATSHLRPTRADDAILRRMLVRAKHGHAGSF